MDLDDDKVQSKLDELGAGWMVMDGLHAITGLEFKGSQAVFQPSRGIPVKLFVHNTTGEIRVFAAVIFREDGSKV